MADRKAVIKNADMNQRKLQTDAIDTANRGLEKYSVAIKILLILL